VQRLVVDLGSSPPARRHFASEPKSRSASRDVERLDPEAVAAEDEAVAARVHSANANIHRAS
jgi:hypothetical protein